MSCCVTENRKVENTTEVIKIKDDQVCIFVLNPPNPFVKYTDINYHYFVFSNSHLPDKPDQQKIVKSNRTRISKSITYRSYL